MEELNRLGDSMREELWKDIKGYEGLYKVSSLGQIKSLTRLLSDGRVWKEHILSQETNYGYKRVVLVKNNIKKHYRVHKLVAQAFIPNPYKYTIINHKDENKANNNIENLEWCSSKYNSNYGNCKYKIANKLSKPVMQYTKNFELLNTYKSLSEVGRQTGYSIGYISQCCNGKCYSAYGYIWRWANENI